MRLLNAIYLFFLLEGKFVLKKKNKKSALKEELTKTQIGQRETKKKKKKEDEKQSQKRELDS